jgi:hypothetical protein
MLTCFPPELRTGPQGAKNGKGPRIPVTTPRHPGPTLRRPGLVVLLLLLAPISGCDLGFPESDGEAELDRDTFVATYTELRLAAMEWESAQLPEAERDRILSERGVTESQLRDFVRVHGRNVPFMNEIWNEVADQVSRALQEEAEEAEAPEDEGGG